VADGQSGARTHCDGAASVETKRRDVNIPVALMAGQPANQKILAELYRSSGFSTPAQNHWSWSHT
jgi:hypothetical protein